MSWLKRTRILPSLILLTASFWASEPRSAVAERTRAGEAPSLETGTVAPSTTEEFRAHFGLRLAALGHLDLGDDPVSDESRHARLGRTWGGEFGVGWVGRTLGIELAARVDGVELDWREPHQGTDYGSLVSVFVAPRVGRALRRQPMELYGSGALGVVIPALRGSNLPDGAARPGVMFEAALGLSYFLVPRFGVGLESGLTLYRINLRGTELPEHMRIVQWSVLRLKAMLRT